MIELKVEPATEPLHPGRFHGGLLGQATNFLGVAFSREEAAQLFSNINPAAMPVVLCVVVPAAAVVDSMSAASEFFEGGGAVFRDLINKYEVESKAMFKACDANPRETGNSWMAARAVQCDRFASALKAIKADIVGP